MVIGWLSVLTGLLCTPRSYHLGKVVVDTKLKPSIMHVCERRRKLEKWLLSREENNLPSFMIADLTIVLAGNGRLRHIESMAKRFIELTMAHRGEVKAVVTTVIPLPPEEDRELKETLQDILGHGKKVKLEQKIDPSILGGIVVEFGQKVFDMSIKTRARQMERFLREPVA